MVRARILNRRPYTLRLDLGLRRARTLRSTFACGPPEPTRANWATRPVYGLRQRQATADFGASSFPKTSSRRCEVVDRQLLLGKSSGERALVTGTGLDRARVASVFI